MLELYHFHGATRGLKARFAFAVKGADYIERVVERPYLKTPDYLKLNPNGVAPTLIDEGLQSGVSDKSVETIWASAINEADK